MDAVYVPAELAKGDKKGRHGVKRVRWNPGSDTLELDDLFAKKLQEYRSKQDIAKEDGVEEEEDDDDDKNEEDEEEYSTEGDYSEKEEFDDDEDEYNKPEEEDEPYY